MKILYEETIANRRFPGGSPRRSVKNRICSERFLCEQERRWPP